MGWKALRPRLPFENARYAKTRLSVSILTFLPLMMSATCLPAERVASFLERGDGESSGALMISHVVLFDSENASPRRSPLRSTRPTRR